jgi:hypothetical protein
LKLRDYWLLEVGMRWIVGVAAMAALITMGCGGDDSEVGATPADATSSGCTFDSDCGSGQICDQGACISPGGDAGDAGADSAGDGAAATDTTGGAGGDTTTTGTDDGGTTAGEDTGGADTGGATTGGATDGGTDGPKPGDGSGATCDETNPCPDGEFCCDTGTGGGGYCEIHGSLCYGPGCEGDGDCGEGRECCEAQGVIPAFCAPEGGCYGPQCTGDSDCAAGQACCPFDVPLVPDICGPADQCIGNSCSADSDCADGTICCQISAFGFDLSLCLLNGLCELAKNAAAGGGGPGGGGPGDGGAATDGGDQGGETTGDAGGETDGGDAGGATDGGDAGGQTGGADECASSDDCGFGQCCPQEDGGLACQTVCPCETGADCLDNGCCVSNLGTACTPENVCFGGEWDPAPGN